MRTIFLNLAILAMFLACNSEADLNKDKANSTTSVEPAIKNINRDASLDCSHAGNLLIKPEVADKMIKLFRKHYKETLKYLSDSVWIDSCVISGFAKYFETNSNFDGTRVYSGVSGGSSTNTIMLVATIPGDGSTPKKRHIDDLSANILLSSRDCNKEFKNFNLDSHTFDAMKKKFGKDFRKEDSGNKIDSLSISVWVNNCVFKILSELFRTHPDVYDGATVYFAAYDKRDTSTRRGQLYQYQSTIIIVPTKPDGRRHTPDWEILTSGSFYQKYFKGEPFDGFNHGELCPDVCNEG